MLLNSTNLENAKLPFKRVQTLTWTNDKIFWHKGVLPLEIMKCQITANSVAKCTLNSQITKIGGVLQPGSYPNVDQ